MIGNFPALIVLGARNSSVVIAFNFDEVVSVLDLSKFPVCISKANDVPMAISDLHQNESVTAGCEFLGEAGAEFQLEGIL